MDNLLKCLLQSIVHSYFVIFVPISILVFFSLFLAIFNKTSTLRKFYLQYLLRVFKIAGQVTSLDNEEGKKIIHSKHNLIHRDDLILEPTFQQQSEDYNTEVVEGIKFNLEDILDYIKTGLASIIEDEVTSRFEAETLRSWNLLTRTWQSFHYVNMRLTIIWILGSVFRYGILFPIRFFILVIGIMNIFIVNFVAYHLFSNESLKNKFYEFGTVIGFRIISQAISAVIKFHDSQNRPKANGICVANHTSPIDVIMLSCDRSYAMVGQTQGGLFGWFQRTLSMGSSHIWFERSKAEDRNLVFNTLKAHSEASNTLPICIFPEGTCINNTSVMQFKKGSFEIGAIIYPVAMKYNPQFGDPFWNSSKDGMLAYVLNMMTSWAIVVDVWYLPPMKKLPQESSIDFANRVKKKIALKGGLVDLTWDGNLKRNLVKKEWKQVQQKEFSTKLRRKK